jgi:FtsZ-binding cell division protein ZapB
MTVGGMSRRSETKKKTLNPKWDQKFVLYSDNPETILFHCFDWDRASKDDPLGDAELQTLNFFAMKEVTTTGVVYEGTLALKNVARGSIKVKITFRKLAPLRTEKLLQQAEQNLKVLIASRTGKGGGAVFSEEKVKEYEHLKVLVEEQQKEVDDLRFRNNTLKEELESSNHALQAAMAASNAAQSATPGDVKKELTQALTKIAFLEGENTALKNQKHQLQYELDSVKGRAGVDMSTSYSEAHGIATVEAPCCVIFGAQCTIS